MKPVLKKLLLALWRNDRGATAIEYGLIMSAVAIALMAVIFSMGDSLINIFDSINTKIMSVL